MNIANPHPADALTRRKRVTFVEPEKLTKEQLQELNDQKQAELGATVLKQIKAKETSERRAHIQLRRGQPTVADEMQEAVAARMGPNDIPTKGNT